MFEDLQLEEAKAAERSDRSGLKLGGYQQEKNYGAEATRNKNNDQRI